MKYYDCPKLCGVKIKYKKGKPIPKCPKCGTKMMLGNKDEDGIMILDAKASDQLWKGITGIVGELFKNS